VLLAIALAVGGIMLLQLAKAESANARGALLGNLLMFGAVVCEAIYVIIAKRLSATRTPLRVSALINLWGLALIAPFGLWSLASFDLGTLNAGHWSLLVFYSLAASLFAVWMWVTGLKHFPASQAGVFTVALPMRHRGRRAAARRTVHRAARGRAGVRFGRRAADRNRAPQTERTDVPQAGGRIVRTPCQARRSSTHSRRPAAAGAAGAALIFET
jgi:hypothetical protein